MTGVTRKGKLGGAVAAVLLGGGLAVLGAGRAWARASASAAPGLPVIQLAPTGGELAPGVVAMALVALAGVLALAASRRAWRILVGAVVALAGAGITVLAATVGDARAVAAERAGAALGATTPTVTGVVGTPWPLVTAAAGALVAAAGTLIAVRGPHWAGLGRRYDAPSVAAPSGARRPAERGPAQRRLWEALDRGEDPTADRG